jgi:hypothetical protein
VSEPESAEFYRKRAARLRKIAESIKHPKTKVELLELAAQFEKLAEFSKATHSHPTKDSS